MTACVLRVPVDPILQSFQIRLGVIAFGSTKYKEPHHQKEAKYRSDRSLHKFLHSLRKTAMPSSTSLILLLLTLAVSKAAKTSFGNDEVTVEVAVNANVPKYTFQATNDPAGNRYNVFFSKIYESKNGKKVGGSNLALPSLDWIISAEDNSDSVVFWINGTSKVRGGGNQGGGGSSNANPNGGGGGSPNGGGGSSNGNSNNKGGGNGGGNNAGGGNPNRGGGAEEAAEENNSTGAGGRELQGNSNKSDPFTVLAFRNEILGTLVKFDVFLQGYVWVDAQADSLNLEWRMKNATANGGEDEELDQKEEEDLDEESRRLQQDPNATEASNVTPNEICFYGKSASSDDGDAKNQVCWGIEEEASTSESAVPVALSLKGGFIIVSYRNWGEGDLFHDPTFGFKVTDDGDEQSGGRDDPSDGFEGGDGGDGGGAGGDPSGGSDGIDVGDSSSNSNRTLQTKILGGLLSAMLTFALFA